MKVLLFSPFGNSNSHHETDLEFAIRCTKNGDTVHVIQCHRQLKACEANASHQLLECLRCSSISQRSWDLAGIPRSQRHSIESVSPLSERSIPHFRNLAELKQYRWKGNDVGLIVASTLITLDHNPFPEVAKHRAYIVKMIQDYARVYDSVFSTITKIKPDLFFVFNGRTSITNPGVQAAKRNGIRFTVGERDNFKRYFLLENAIAGDLPFLRRTLIKYRDQMKSDPHSERLATEWFVTNRNGNKEQLQNYVRKQIIGKIPHNFDRSKHNIGVFTSSEWEIAGIPGWENPLFRDQIECLKFILNRITTPMIHFFVRIHPNQGNFQNAQLKALEALQAPNLTMIPPLADIDTYALMESVDTVLTFGSTVGIEATFWNKPSVLVGRAIWDGLGATYNPQTPAEIIELLTKKLIPRPKSTALAYGYLWKKRGIPFEYLSPENPVQHTASELHGHILGPYALVRQLLLWVSRAKRWSERLRILIAPSAFKDRVEQPPNG